MELITVVVQLLVDLHQWGVSRGILSQKISHSVRVVFDHLGDVFPGVVVILEAAPGHQQLDLSLWADASTTQLFNLELSHVMLRRLNDDRREREILACKQARSGPMDWLGLDVRGFHLC